ncbi:hypothetical protein [Ravibacter arvi]
MENTRFKRFFGALLTVIGILLVLFACVAFLSDKPVFGLEITKWETLVPFVVGALFMIPGVSLISNS